MSKAEDLAEKAYPKGDIYIFGDASIACQVAYVKGYHQAAKDNALTWEDIVYIIETYNELEFSREFATVTFNDTCKEVLKRFNEMKDE